MQPRVTVEMHCPLCGGFITSIEGSAGTIVELRPCPCGVKTTVELRRDSTELSGYLTKLRRRTTIPATE
jgi:hypothetical protein